MIGDIERMQRERYLEREWNKVQEEWKVGLVRGKGIRGGEN